MPRYHRTYEKLAQTPYQMLIDSKRISSLIKVKQETVRQRLNLFDLKQEIDRLITLVYDTQRNYDNQKS